MDVPKPPTSWDLKLGGWLLDFARMPGRLRRLAEIVEADRDPRQRCTGCGVGRVGVVARQIYPTSGHIQTQGKCTRCGMLWFMSPDGTEIASPWIEPINGEAPQISREPHG